MRHHRHLAHLIVVGGLLLLILPRTVGADETMQWQQIIGIIQAGNTVGSGSGKVTGGGQPWHTTSGRAEVNLTTGDLQFSVQGLVLAGGNAIGTPGNVTQVKGTLVCDTTGTGDGDSTLVDTDLVTLSAQGDADFSDNVGALPDACVTAPNLAFLIRTASGAWIASGEVRVSSGDPDPTGRCCFTAVNCAVGCVEKTGCQGELCTLKECMATLTEPSGASWCELVRPNGPCKDDKCMILKDP